jgi:hypothetical protein
MSHSVSLLPSGQHPPTSFIWRSEEPFQQRNAWTRFRRHAAYDGGAADFFFAADPTARLLVNGKTVVARCMRFVTPFITVERVDLGPFLRPGDNCFEILHHWWGVPTFQRSRGGSPGVSLVGEWLRTDTSWEWCEAAEFVAHEHQILGHSTQRIRFPVAIDLCRPVAGVGQWHKAAMLESAAWSSPVLKETPPLRRRECHPCNVHSGGKLLSVQTTDCPFPEIPGSWLMKRSTFCPEPNAPGFESFLEGEPISIDAEGDYYLTFDFGRPVHGYVSLTVESEADGTAVDLTYCELDEDPSTGKAILQPDGSFDPDFTVGSPYCDRVLLRAGQQEVEIPEERTFRWLMLAFRGVRGPLKLCGLTAWSTEHPSEVVGSFHGPPFVSEFQRLALIHAAVAMSDVFVDTPGREDAQWLEDIPVRARIAASWMEDTSLRLVALRHAAEQQAPSGRFRIFAPEDYGEAGLQCLDWGMAWPDLLWDAHQWSGEVGLVARYWKHLEAFVASLLAECDADGLLVDGSCLGDIRCSEHADFTQSGRESIPNAFMHGCLLRASAMARLVGEVDAAAKWSDQARLCRTAFTRFLVTGNRVAEVWSPSRQPRGFGQAAAVCAAYFEVLDPDTRRAVLLEAFRPPSGAPPADMRRWNNPTYAYRALVALSENGLPALAAAHFHERYEPWIARGILPEYFLPGTAQPPDASGSHAWAASPLAWLHEYVLGLRPSHAVGEWTYSPVDVGWSRVWGEVVTPFGHLLVENDWKSGAFCVRNRVGRESIFEHRGTHPPTFVLPRNFG